MTKRARESRRAMTTARRRRRARRRSRPEIVRLNVGGRAFITTRSTLCAVPGSMLAVKFQVPTVSGRR